MKSYVQYGCLAIMPICINAVYIWTASSSYAQSTQFFDPILYMGYLYWVGLFLRKKQLGPLPALVLGAGAGIVCSVIFLLQLVLDWTAAMDFPATQFYTAMLMTYPRTFMNLLLPDGTALNLLISQLLGVILGVFSIFFGYYKDDVRRRFPSSLDMGSR